MPLRSSSAFALAQSRDLELKPSAHYGQTGRYIITVKVINILVNDTMTLMP